jgi:twitching motility two-component system response regulator PilH
MSNILVVDDHPETLQVVGLILRQNGYEIMTAENGLEAVEMAVKHTPDLILMDIMMPIMDGYEASRRIAATPHLKDVPIIMFSVKSQADDKMTAFNAGARDFLVKPTDPEELLNRIAILLNKEAPPAYEEPTAFPEFAVSPDDGQPLPGDGQPLPGDGQPLFGSRLVIFTGARGGVGTTTAAIHFTATLARLNQAALLLDLDMVQAHVALYLKQKMRGSLHDLTKYHGDDLKFEIPQRIVTHEGGWQILLSQPNLDRRLPSLNKTQVETLLNVLSQPGRWLVADIGCGFDRWHEPLLARADHIFVCLRPERIAIASARLALRRLAVFCQNEAALRPLMIDFSGQNNLPRHAVEQFLQRPLAGIVPIASAQMNQFVNNAQLLIEPEEDNPTAVALRQIAEGALTAHEEQSY